MNDSGQYFVPGSGVRAILDEVRSFGHQELETGGFLMMPRDETTVSTVALSGTSGIVRRHNLFQISARALDRLFTYAAAYDLWIPIQFHSHGIGAFLSHADETYGLCVEGFISVVIPYFAQPPADMSAWGWWQYTEGQWLERMAAKDADGEISVVSFDEDGVHAC